MGVGPQLGLAGPDVGVAQAALAEVQGQAAEGRLLLPGDEVGRQVERRLGDQLAEDLVADGLAPLVLVPPLQDALQGVAEVGQVVEAGRREERGVELGQAERLEVEDVEGDLDRLAPEVRVGRGRADPGVGLALLARA